MRIRKQIRQKLKPVELFDTIHDGGIWQHNWEQFMITGKRHWLIKDRREKKRHIKDSRFQEVYFKLYDEYSQASGDHERMYKWALLMEKRMIARALYGAGDLFQINFIEMYTEMIDNLMRSDEDVNIKKNRLQVQQLYGQKINEKETTVGDFILYQQLVSEQNQPTNTASDG